MMVFKYMAYDTHKVVPFASGDSSDLCSPAMHHKGMPKRDKPSQMVIANNLERILTARALDTAGAAKVMGVTTFQMTRLLSGEHAVTLRTLDRIAAAFGYEPYQLLVPDLNAGNPQILRVLSAAEERLYKALEEARKDPPL